MYTVNHIPKSPLLYVRNLNSYARVIVIFLPVPIRYTSPTVFTVSLPVIEQHFPVDTIFMVIFGQSHRVSFRYIHDLFFLIDDTANIDSHNHHPPCRKQ